MFSSISKQFFSTTLKTLNGINDITVIGGGQMGSGIAQVIAQSGKKVIVVDQSDSILQRSKEGISHSLKRVGKKKFGDDTNAIDKMISSALSNITFSSTASEASSNADLVIEAIVEDLEAKRALFKELEKVAKPTAIFASNTSGLSITKIAEATNRKDRVVGLHFFHPVPVMKLVEVVVTPELSESTLNAVLEFGKSIDKVCVKCKDTPGFIVNRILVPYLMDAVKLAERGDASLEDIDMGMKLGCGYPKGPIELIDYTGLDILETSMENWSKEIPGPRMQTSELLSQRVREGKLGMKVGKGFYNYTSK